jgi:DNA-binding Lrp family transcriptional regulator
MIVTTDELDEQIIEALRQDGRASNRSIGRALGVGESTVRKRLKRLERANALRLAVICDPSFLHVEAFALLRVSVAPAEAEKVARFLASLEETSFVAHSIGQYNLMALLSAPTKHDLARALHGKIAPLDSVSDIEVREIVDVVKYQFDLVMITPDAT